MEDIEIKQIDFEQALNDLREKGKTEFSSHELIQRFAANAEREYITMLYDKLNTDHPFQAVHLHIGRELEMSQTNLHIEKTRKDKSINIFGNEDVVQYWRFI